MKKNSIKKFIIKLLMCMVYIVIIAILFACSYKIFIESGKIKSWQEIDTTDEYTYITISKMSEKFAFYKDDNIGIHFVIEEENGKWNTYLIAIDENTYDDYKSIIDYSYERREQKPEPIRVYGYPTTTDQELRELAIKNIVNFIPADKEITITDENYEEYFTNSYLDTTREKEEKFNLLLFGLLLLMFFMLALLVITILGRDKIVDKVDKHLDEDIDRAKLMFQRAREKKRKKSSK